ncbi:MAG: DUF4328 domain-containing protein [Arachnia sp.]
MTTPLPPAGWYASPDGSPGLRWWDGARWTDDRRPIADAPPPPTAPNRLPRLSVWVRALILISSAAALVDLLHELAGMLGMQRYLAGDLDAYEQLVAYDERSVVLIFVWLGSTLAAGIAWMIWQHRAASLVAVGLKRSPAWHAWSWVIPFAAYILPYQNVSDLWRQANTKAPAWLPLWWGLWIGGSLAGNVAGRLYATADELDSFIRAAQLTMLGDALLIAATPFAWLILKDLTRALTARPAAPAPWHPHAPSAGPFA